MPTSKPPSSASPDPDPYLLATYRIKRCTFRRLTEVEAGPERVYDVECLYPDRLVPLPLGDISSHQARLLSAVARRFVGDTVRTTVEQNIVFRWVRLEDLRDLHASLAEIGMADPYAETIVDVTSCPGTDTCKLGISASRGLAGELRQAVRIDD